MKIKLAKKEKLEVFEIALCNAAGTGYFQGHGFTMDYSPEEYAKSKAKLTNPYWEEILMQMLKDGCSITFKDIEGDGAYTKTLDIALIIDNMKKVPTKNILNIINEEDDVDDADAVLQYILFGELIFG